MSSMLLRRQLLGLDLGGLLGAAPSQAESAPLPASQVVSVPQQPSASEAASPQPVPASNPVQADPVPLATSDHAVQQQQLPAGLTLEQMQQLQQAQLFREQQQLQVQHENSPSQVTGLQDQTLPDRHETILSASSSNREFINFTQTAFGSSVKSIQVPTVKSQDQVQATSTFSGVQPTLDTSMTDAITPTTAVGLALGISIPAFALLAAFIYVMCKFRRTSSASATTEDLKSSWAPPLSQQKDPYHKEIEVKSGAEVRSNSLTNLQRFPALYSLATRNSSVRSNLSIFTLEYLPDATKTEKASETRISRQFEQHLEAGLDSELFCRQVSDVSYRISVRLPACDGIDLETNVDTASSDTRNTG
ncbi:hypothetical protein HDU81_002363 [Chytriomyces hyalinus]|nr:hypothetical protein HDU81_002363 [Chytriomyces hyalinus]